MSGIWIARKAAETKGRTLEEIEQIFETVGVPG